MKKWKMMALICVLCGSLSGCGLSFCGIPLGKREPLTFVCGEKNVEMQADEEADGGKLSEQDGTEVQMTDASETVRDGTASADTSVTSTQSDTSYSDGKVNINTASKEELIGLNGIGEVLADRIIEYREANGGYKDVRELTNVKGIGEKLLEKLLPYVTG